MAKHIHIHLPKNAIPALLLPKKTQDAEAYKATYEQSKFGKKGYRPKVLGSDGRTVFLSQASFLTEMEAIRVAQSYADQLKRGVGEPRTPFQGTADSDKTGNDALGELRRKRQRLEEELDKSDDSGDNRQMDRIKKELAQVNKSIKEVEKKDTKDADHKSFTSIYSTARDKAAGKVYKVVAQDAKSKDQVRYLLLKMPHANVWWSIDKLEPVI
jgi:flagellar motility protein MotE (MotC chaperone)